MFQNLKNYIIFLLFLEATLKWVGKLYFDFLYFNFIQDRIVFIYLDLHKINLFFQKKKKKKGEK